MPLIKRTNKISLKNISKEGRFYVDVMKIIDSWGIRDDKTARLAFCSFFNVPIDGTGREAI
jgi:hypothetical protein